MTRTESDLTRRVHVHVENSRRSAPVFHVFAERYIPLTLDLFFDNLRRHVAGRPLRNRVDVRRGY